MKNYLIINHKLEHLFSLMLMEIILRMFKFLISKNLWLIWRFKPLKNKIKSQIKLFQILKLLKHWRKTCLLHHQTNQSMENYLILRLLKVYILAWVDGLSYVVLLKLITVNLSVKKQENKQKCWVFNWWTEQVWKYLVHSLDRQQFLLKIH